MLIGYARVSTEDQNVTNGVIEIHFHRNHREPVIHLVIWRRFFARTYSASRAHWAGIS